MNGHVKGLAVSGHDALRALACAARTITCAPDRRRHAQKYAQALSGQLVLGAFSFCLNLYLLRQLSLPDYGLFAFTQFWAQLAGQLNGALVATPLLVHLPALPGAVARCRFEILMFSANGVMVAAFAVISAGCAAVIGLDAPAALLFAAFIAATTLRNFSRCLAFAKQRPDVTLTGDLCLVAASLGGLALLVGASAEPGLAPVFGALTLAHLLTAALELTLVRSAPVVRLNRSALRRYRRIWQEVRWALLGSSTTIVQAQAHSLMVTFAAGAGAYAPLAAAQVLFGPIGIMINAVQNVMRPELAAAIARGNRRGVMVASALSTGLLVLAVIVFGGLLALAWPWIEAALYAEKYQTQPMAAIALGCWAIALCRAVYTPPGSLLQAMRQFRPLALGTVGGAVLSTMGVAASLVFLTSAWSLAGVLAGESLFAVYAVRRAIAGFGRR